jgi:hypothetical protein
LKQRWRYRVKTGQMLVHGAKVNRGKIVTFLVAGTAAILLSPIIVVPYAVLAIFLGARVRRLPPSQWAVLPFAFAAHHLTYYFGILWGIVRGLIGGR